MAKAPQPLPIELVNVSRDALKIRLNQFFRNAGQKYKAAYRDGWISAESALKRSECNKPDNAHLRRTWDNGYFAFIKWRRSFKKAEVMPPCPDMT